MKAELIEKITDIVYEEVVKNNYGKVTLTAKLNELLNNYNVVKNIAYEPVLADVWQTSDRPFDAYPIGTKARAGGGGYWIKNERGWKWCTGATFPRPGGDWDGMVSLPSCS